MQRKCFRKNESIECLLRRRVYVEASIQGNRTSSHFFCYEGHDILMQLLLDQEAKLNNCSKVRTSQAKPSFRLLGLVVRWHGWVLVVLAEHQIWLFFAIQEVLLKRQSL